MAKIVKKLFSDKFPERVHVLKEHADFDHRGMARVSEEAAIVFTVVPGYEILGEAAEEGIEVAVTDNDKLEGDTGENNDNTELENSTDENNDNAEIEGEIADGAGNPKPKKLKRVVPATK